jgi:hypothetical protein
VGALLFRWRHKRVVGKRAAVIERAELIARMVMLIVRGLQTKSYGEFVESFSNPGGEPASLERLNQQLRFQMRISPTCWYDATAEYPADGIPFFHIEGSGDDWGVLISGNAVADHTIGVDFFVPTNSQAGRDAHAIVRALRRVPGWSRASDIEIAGFAADRRRGSSSK